MTLTESMELAFKASARVTGVLVRMLIKRHEITPEQADTLIRHGETCLQALRSLRQQTGEIK